MVKAISFNIKVPIYVEVGVRKKRKYYSNLNIYRNLPFHLSNSLKKEMKLIIAGVVPKEYLGINIQNYELTYTLYLPNKLRRDIANVCSIVDKQTADALVELDVLEDDNYLHLKKVTYLYGGYDDNKKGYVNVHVQEVLDG